MISQCGPDSVEFDLASPWYDGRFRVNIPGRFSVYNALAAAGISGLYGLPAAAVRRA